MQLELQNFVWSLYPSRGYKIQAWSPGVDPKEWKAFCEPPPVEDDILKSLSRVWSLQKYRNDIVLSMYAYEGIDEFQRPGQYSHHIIIPRKIYTDNNLTPFSFTDNFNKSPKTIGNITPVTVDPLQRKQPDNVLLSALKPKTLEKVLFFLLSDKPFRLICPGYNTEKMLNFVSVLLKLLPRDIEIVPFITAPLDRRFDKERIRLKLVESYNGHEDSINIAEDVPNFSDTSPEGKMANILANQYLKSGMAGLQEIGQSWKNGEEPPKINISEKAKNFVTSYEVKRGAISIGDIKNLIGKGQKQEAKRLSRAIIRERKWQNSIELADLLAISLFDISDLTDGEFWFITDTVKDLSPFEKLDTYNRLVVSLPRLRNQIVSRLWKLYGFSLLTAGSILQYPLFFDNALEKNNIGEFVTVCREILNDSRSNRVEFENRVEYLLEKARVKFTEHTLTLLTQLLTDFPEHRLTIVSKVRKEDILPISMANKIPKEIRQKLNMRLDQFIFLSTHQSGS